MTKAPVEADEARATGDGSDRQRAIRAGNVGAVVLTVVLLVVMGLGLQVGVAAGERDPHGATAPTRSRGAPRETTTSTTSTTSASGNDTETEVLSAEMTRFPGKDGDLAATVTVNVDPTWSGAVALRVEATDPTGTVASESGPSGLGAVVTVMRDGKPVGNPVSVGDTRTTCDGVDPGQGPTPARMDERRTIESSAGPATLTVTITSSRCTAAENRVVIDADVAVP